MIFEKMLWEFFYVAGFCSLFNCCCVALLYCRYLV